MPSSRPARRFAASLANSLLWIDSCISPQNNGAVSAQSAISPSSLASVMGTRSGNATNSSAATSKATVRSAALARATERSCPVSVMASTLVLTAASGTIGAPPLCLRKRGGETRVLSRQGIFLNSISG
jgi:hypothetical protein